MIIHLYDYRGEDKERRTEGQEERRRGGEEDLRRTKGQGLGGEVNKKEDGRRTEGGEFKRRR